MKNKMTKTDRFNSEKIESEEKNAFSQFFHSCGVYIHKNYAFLILFFVGLFAVSAINFMKITTVQTVANFSISDFEIGQISDRTIIADRSLSPDELDPVNITKGEKIIKKGFPITEEGYAKLKKMAASPLYIDYRAFANSELFIFLLAKCKKRCIVITVTGIATPKQRKRKEPPETAKGERPMREIMTAQEWIAKGYPYVFEGTQGSFYFVLMDEYDFEDTNTKKPLLVKDGFDTEGYGLGPATARDIFDRIAGLEDVIRGLKKYREEELDREGKEVDQLVSYTYNAK